MDQNRNWTVRLSSRKCLCGLNASIVVREPLSYGELNFMDFFPHFEILLFISPKCVLGRWRDNTVSVGSMICRYSI